MSTPGWSPPLASDEEEKTAYLVMDDLVEQGRVWRETDADAVDLEGLRV